MVKDFIQRRNTFLIARVPGAGKNRKTSEYKKTKK